MTDTITTEQLERARDLSSTALGYVQAGQTDPQLYEMLLELDTVLHGSEPAATTRTRWCIRCDQDSEHPLDQDPSDDVCPCGARSPRNPTIKTADDLLKALKGERL